MKKIHLYILLLASAVLLGSCEDNFDAKIYGSLSTTNFPSTEADYENYMMLCYVPFGANWGYDIGNGWQYGFYDTPTGILRFFDSPTDITAPFTVGTQPDKNLGWTPLTQCKFDDFALWEATAHGTMVYFGKVRDITRMTQIIGTIEKSETLPEAKKMQLLSEARFLRGMSLYYLLHYFGPVPVILDAELVGNAEAESHLERPTLAEYVGYVTDDLEFAVENLPEVQEVKGRYNADYARFCLMRHYLNEGAEHPDFYRKAYDLFEQFTGTYSLFESGTNPYVEMFKVANKFNNEYIMEVYCTTDGESSGGNFNSICMYSQPPEMISNVSGWGQAFNISKPFYDSFEPGDLRKEAILTSYETSEGTITEADLGAKWNGFIMNKYAPETKTSYQQATDFPLARWADVLLLRAEADARANNVVSADAIAKVNAVRARAGLSSLPASATASTEAFLDAILMERGHELFFEGCRKIDLIRFGKYYKTMSASFERVPTSQYYPIPQTIMEQAKKGGYNLTQYFTRDNYDGPKR